MDISKLLIQAANLSISAGWLVLAVLLARLLLKKAPRWAHVTLWGIVGLRLVLPLTWESALSLLPSRETIPQEIVTSPSPGIQSGVPMLDSFVNPVLQQQFTPNPGDSVNPLQVWLFVGAVVWLVGMGLLLGYTLFTYIRLRRRVATAVWLEENVYQSEFVASPFVLGLLRARIYLPYGLAGEAMAHVLAHEQAHLRRKDHWWKPLGFLLLTIYWFNPLLWVAYVLLCRDIELACDEKVVKKLDTQQRADYSQALLSCSVSRRSIAACPLAFGEVGVKQRIKSVLHYKKPAFWLVLVAVIACIALAVGFLTAPKPEHNFDPLAQTDPFISTDPPAQTDPSASTNHPVQTDPPYQTNPPVQPVDNLTWAQILKSEDVVSIYVERTFDSDFYADSAQIQRIVEILNQVEGVYRQDGQENDGGYVRFIVETQSGRTFEVKNNGGLYFSINGFYYEVPSSWLNAWWEEWASADVPPIQTDPPVRPVDSLTWAQTLKAEDVDNIVVYYFGNGGEWYAKLTDAQIAEAVALINQSHGEKIEPESSPAPGNLIRFEVTTKNGVYTLTDGSGSYLCISGEYYQADKGWLRTWQKWQLVAVNFVEGWPVTTYTFQTGQALHTLEELSAQVSLDSNGRLMILDTEGWGPALGQLYQEEVFPNSEWYLPYLPNFAKTCQQVKDMVGQPGQLWICPYNYPTSGIIYFKLFLLYQTEDGSLYMGATKFQTGQEDDDKLLYLYQLDLVTQTTDEPHIWAQNLKAEDIAAMTLLVRGETYQLEPGTRKFQRYLAKITQASGTKMATMENAYAFDVTILVDTTDGKRHIVVNDSGEKLMIDGYYYQVDTDWLYSWWEEWRQS